MELPKNITQIGESDHTCKVYVEDYVVSYMKQLSRRSEDKRATIALYGKYTKEQNLSYFFIYGACQVLSINKEVRHLSQAQNQEIERLRQRYFPEYVFLGYHIFDGEMVEGMHIMEQDICRYIKGYACFYEKNDSMLAYMLDNQLEKHEPEQYGQEKYERVRVRQLERRSQYEQKEQSQKDAIVSDNSSKHDKRKAAKAPQSSSLKMMRMSAAAVFAVLCLVGVAAVTRESDSTPLGEQARQLMAQLSSSQPVEEDGQGDEANQDEAKQEDTDIHNSGTLVAEDSLADAILQENQQVAEVSGQAVTDRPDAEAANDMQDNPQNDMDNQYGENASEAAQEGVDTSAQNPEDAEIPAQGPAVSEIEEQGMTEQQPVSYVIQPGDTLIGISTRQYGNDSHIQEICRLNGISDPDNIQIGQKILLP